MKEMKNSWLQYSGNPHLLDLISFFFVFNWKKYVVGINATHKISDIRFVLNFALSINFLINMVKTRLM